MRNAQYLVLTYNKNITYLNLVRDFPCGPVAKTPHS